MPTRRTYPQLLALLLLGCASAPKPAAVAPANDVPPAAELVAQGQGAAKRGDAVRAEQYLAMALQQGAEKSLVMPMLLRACLRSSHLRAALNHAQPYLLEHPEDDALRFLVATVHVGLGQRADARRELNLLLERSPTDADGHYLLGILDADFDMKAARTHFEAAAVHTTDEDRRLELQSRLAQLRLREREVAEVAP